VGSVQGRALVGLMFIFAFVVKMGISLVPLLSLTDAKSATTAIIQLEQESKGDKDDIEKDICKERKGLDELLLAVFRFTPVLPVSYNPYNIANSPVVQSYHPTVPTPPPNV